MSNDVAVVDEQLQKELNDIPDKMAFKIGEVADIAGVKSYVLRYWETEFDALKPKKSKHNQRMYHRKDIENVLMIKKLLYRDRFSIEGARKALRGLKRANKEVESKTAMLIQKQKFEEKRQNNINELLQYIHSIKVNYEAY